MNTGGSAFPIPPYDSGQGGMDMEFGMTLRDWFAATTCSLDEDASVTACEELLGKPFPHGEGFVAQWKFWAKADAVYRYLKADAMLAERDK